MRINGSIYTHYDLIRVGIYKPVHFLLISEFQEKHNLTFDEVIEKLLKKEKQNAKSNCR